MQTFALSAGTYGFSVSGGRVVGSADAPSNGNQGLRLPAMLVSSAPTPQASQLEVYPAPGTLDRWLSAPGDHITVRVLSGEVAMLLTSVRRQQDQPLSIDVVRLDQPLPAQPDKPQPLRVMLHVQVLGDLFFSEGHAGPVHSGLAVEAFIVDCQDAAHGNVAEYRALTADGFETPWLTNGTLCGSRGRGVPLVGFAVRPRVQAAKRRAFRYEGYFRRAGWVAADPAKGWCKSPLPDDPLEGLALYPVDLA